MSRRFPLLAGALIALGTPFAAQAQARSTGAEWPALGTRLDRVEEVPATSPTSLPGGGSGATDLSRGACAMRVRDPQTRQEFLIQHSEVRQSVDRDSVGTTTTRVATKLEHAVGEYRRIPAGTDTTESRRLTVDCISSRVVAPAKGR